MPAPSIALGASCLIAGEFLLVLMVVIIKHLSETMSTEVIVFFRNLFGLIVILPFLARSGLSQIRTAHFHLHLLRTAVGLAGMYGYFYVVGHMALAEATLVKLTAPFFIPIIGFFWLGESIQRRTSLAILVGFIGVIFILRPGTENFEPVAIVGIIAAFFASIAKVSIRRMAITESPTRIVFYFAFLSTLFSAIPLLWAFELPPLAMCGWLVLMGACGTAGQLLMTKAYHITVPGKVGVYTYTSVIFAAFFGWLFWGELLLFTTIAGSGLIIGAGLLNLKPKRRS